MSDSSWHWPSSHVFGWSLFGLLTEAVALIISESSWSCSFLSLKSRTGCRRKAYCPLLQTLCPPTFLHSMPTGSVPYKLPYPMDTRPVTKGFLQNTLSHFLQSDGLNIFKSLGSDSFFYLKIPFSIHFPLLAFYYKQSGGMKQLLQNFA